MALRWWKTSIQTQWISPRLHRETHQSPLARLCPDLNPALGLLILWEMKTESDPAARPLLLSALSPKPWEKWAEVHHSSLGILSGLCFKSCQETQSMRICNSIWLHPKTPIHNFQFLPMKKQYLWPLLLQRILGKPIRNPFLTPFFLKLSIDSCRWQVPAC